MDADLAALLSRSTHDVVYMSEVAPRAADTELMNRAHRENRLLLTENKDFGDLVLAAGVRSGNRSDLHGRNRAGKAKSELVGNGENLRRVGSAVAEAAQ